MHQVTTEAKVGYFIAKISGLDHPFTTAYYRRILVADKEVTDGSITRPGVFVEYGEKAAEATAPSGAIEVECRHKIDWGAGNTIFVYASAQLASGQYWNIGSANATYKDGSTTPDKPKPDPPPETPKPKWPGNWNWINVPKDSSGAGSQVKVTATEWNNFVNKCIAARKLIHDYYGSSSNYGSQTYPVEAGKPMKVNQANEPINILKDGLGLSVGIDLPSKVRAGDPISISFFNDLKDAYNSLRGMWDWK